MPVTKKFKRIFNMDVLCIRNLSCYESAEMTWRYSFELETK